MSRGVISRGVVYAFRAAMDLVESPLIDLRDCLTMDADIVYRPSVW